MTFGRFILIVILSVTFFKTLLEVNEYPHELTGFLIVLLVYLVACIIYLIIPADCFTEVIALFKDVLNSRIF